MAALTFTGQHQTLFEISSHCIVKKDNGNQRCYHIKTDRLGAQLSETVRSRVSSKLLYMIFTTKKEDFLVFQEQK